MAVLNRPRRLSLGSVRVGLRVVAMAVVLLGPIASAAWTLHAPEPLTFGYAELNPETATGAAAEAIREHLARRSPVVDQLLPNGAGGTRVFEDLDGKAGMAFPSVPAIGLAANALYSGWPEATELHERAHLLQAFLPDLVARLLADLPRPAPGEYAATSGREHFAEMAAMAWQIVATPDFACADGTPVERLHELEVRVPGTAGFVMRYLRHLSPSDIDEYDQLVDLASRLAAPHMATFDAVWAAVDQRRLPGGDFRPWERPATARGHVERWRAELRASDWWFDRLGGHLLLPSLALLRVWDTAARQ